jgi:hypothetical protein
MVVKLEAQDNVWSKRFSRNGWVKINDVKRNKTMSFFVFYISKPFNYLFCISPLVQIQFLSQIGVNFI